MRTNPNASWGRNWAIIRRPINDAARFRAESCGRPIADSAEWQCRPHPSDYGDPVYLTEPFIRSSDYLLDETHVIPPYPCEAMVEVERMRGAVPHHLPGTNPVSERVSRPMRAAGGGRPGQARDDGS